MEVLVSSCLLGYQMMSTKIQDRRIWVAFLEEVVAVQGLVGECQGYNEGCHVITTFVETGVCM